MPAPRVCPSVTPEPSLRCAAPASLGLVRTGPARGSPPLPAPSPTSHRLSPGARSRLFTLVSFSNPTPARAHPPCGPGLVPAVPAAHGSETSVAIALATHGSETPSRRSRCWATTFPAHTSLRGPTEKSRRPRWRPGHHDHLPAVRRLVACRPGSLGPLQGALQNAGQRLGLARFPLGAPTPLVLRG